MALIKDKPDPTGVTTSYWIIDSIEINKISMSARIFVTGYKDRGARLEHPSEGAIKRWTYTVPTEDFKTVYERVILGGENLYVLAYNYLTAYEKDLGDSVEPDPVWWSDTDGNLSFFSDAENDFNDLQ